MIFAPTAPRRLAMRRATRVSLALAAAMFVAACGDDEPADQRAVADAPAAENPATPEAPAGVPPAAADPATPAEPATPGGAAPVLEVRELNSWYRVVVIDEAAVADPLELEAVGREICEGLAPCRAAMWFDADQAPAAFPVLEMNLRAQIFGFGRTEAGVENILWNCDYFPQFEAERRCLPRPMN